MTAHEARAVRTGGSWLLWSAQCPCGWTSQAFGKQDAETRALIHRNVKEAIAVIEAESTCGCYDPETCEWDDGGPCFRCHSRQLLGVIP